MPTAQECIRAIREAGGDLSDDEIEEVVGELQRRLDARKADGRLESVEEQLFNDADELAREAAEAAEIERRNRLINIRAFNDLMGFAEEVDRLTGDPALALKAVDVGVNQRFPGARASVDARTNALSAEYLGGMIADLRRDNLLPLLNSRQIDREIAQELAEIGKPGGRPGISENDGARKTAAVIDKYRRAAVARENRAGAWIKPLPGYITRQSHDMHRMRRAGFEAWRDFILPRLDAEATFKGADPEDFLKSAYDGLVTGLHLKANGEQETDLLFAFKGPGNLAKRASEQRVLHFRGADAWFEYNDQFGTRSLVEGIILDLERAARNTALMEAYGTNPRAMREKVVDELRKRHRDDVKKFDRLSARALDLQFDEVEGLTRLPVNPSAAHVNASVRNITSMAKLGGAFLSSLADLAFKAVEIQQQGGRNLFQVWGANMTSFLDGLPAGERRAAAELIGVGLDGQVGDIASRFNATDNLPGKFAKAQQTFFKLNLLAPWTDANKRGIGLMMARDLAMQKSKSWDGLPPQTRELLSLYGFDEAKWTIVRQAARKEADGREYLMPDAIRELSDEVVGATGRKARQIRDELETALRSYYVDRAETAIPTPGAREQAFLRQGTRPGTALGEAVRYVAQFKAFPVTVLTRQLGGLARADSVGQFFRNLVNGKADLLGISHMMIASTLLGYLAQSAKEASKGRSPRDPLSVETWTAAMLQGGGLGIFGDFMFGEFNRFGRTAVETAAGPVISEFGTLVELFSALRNGDDAASRALRSLMNNVPFVNLFYTRLAMEYLFLFQIQEALNPGYLRRMERRLKRDQGQTFLLPPSQAIPRGGGDRLLEGIR